MKPPKMIAIPSEKKVENTYAKEMTEKQHTIDPRPQFCISAELFPAIKEWKTGEKYKLEVEVEQMGSRIETYGDDKGKLIADFRISGIMVDSDKDDSKDKGEKELKKGGEVKSKFPEAMKLQKK